METIKFKEMVQANSQETLVRVLKKYSYYFEPINEYENEHFHCIIRCPVKDPIFGWLKAKSKQKYDEYPIGLSICSCYKEPFVEPIVFTRDDVISIVKDVPNTYIGDDTL